MQWMTAEGDRDQSRFASRNCLICTSNSFLIFSWTLAASCYDINGCSMAVSVANLLNIPLA
jgi:hypothetical protein